MLAEPLGKLTALLKLDLHRTVSCFLFESLRVILIAMVFAFLSQTSCRQQDWR